MVVMAWVQFDNQPREALPGLASQFTRLPDGNIAKAHPTARGIAQAHVDALACYEETTGRWISLDDYAQHGNAQHIRLVHVVASAHRIE